MQVSDILKTNNIYIFIYLFNYTDLHFVALATEIPIWPATNGDVIVILVMYIKRLRKTTWRLTHVAAHLYNKINCVEGT